MSKSNIIRDLLRQGDNDNPINFAELQRVSGVSRSYLLRVYRGDSVPSVLISAKIANALGGDLKFVERKNKE